MFRFKRGSKGFTLIELMVVMAIMAVLAGLVAGAVSGAGTKGQMARLSADEDTIGKSADNFYSEAFPQIYPLDYPADLLPAGMPKGLVGEIKWDVTLPQDPSQSFVPDFLKEIPDSAALVSWRMDTRTSSVFYAQDGAGLIPPSTTELDVKTLNTAPGVGNSPAPSTYTFTTRLKKFEATAKVLKITVPAGYTIKYPITGVIGLINGTFLTDNPWAPGTFITYTGAIEATADVNTWKVTIYFPIGASANTFAVTYDMTVARAGTDTSGLITWDFATARVVDPTQAGYLTPPNWNNSSQSVVISLGSKIVASVVQPVDLIVNPLTKGVYRWLTEEHTSIDIEGVFNPVSGVQAVVIK